MANGSILVGVDGSPESRAALRWALEEARLRDYRLEVVHAWSGYPGVALGTPVVVEDWDLLRSSAEQFAKTIVEETVGEPADVEITTIAVHGMPTPVLVQAAEEADLLVVGSRGRGGFRGLLLGSVSHQCAQHARCPVVIVRAGPAALDGPREEVEATHAG